MSAHVPTEAVVTKSAGYNNAQGHSRGRRVRFVPRTLRELRMARGITLRELAERSGVAAAIVSQVERGRLVATPGEAAALAVALGLEADGLVTRTMLVHEELA